MAKAASSGNTARQWTVAVRGGLVLAVVLFLLLETLVRALGYEPGLRDDSRLWSAQRRLVDSDGPAALVLLGDSRMLSAIDLRRLGELSGQQVRQLAIADASPLPVLENLAADTAFRGTLLVAVRERDLDAAADDARARQWLARFRQDEREGLTARGDARLATYLQQVSAWYAADPAWPDLLLDIVLARDDIVPVTLDAQRQRRADFHAFRDLATRAYLQQVLTELGQPLAADGVQTLAQFTASVHAQLAREPAATRPAAANVVTAFRTAAQRIAARGGKVVFLRLPSSGLIRDIEDARRPRALYWDRLAAAVDGRALHCADDPSLAAFGLPDGSHLDRRDSARFTEDLYTALTGRHLLP